MITFASVIACGLLGPAAEARPARTARSTCSYTRASHAPEPLRFTPTPSAGDGSLSSSLTHYRHPVLLSQAPACSTVAIVGHTYRAALSYRSSTRALSLEVLTHTHTGWRVWYTADRSLKPSSTYVHISLLLRPIQGGVDRLALGLLQSSRGSVHAENFQLQDATRHTPAASAPTSASDALGSSAGGSTGGSTGTEPVSKEAAGPGEETKREEAKQEEGAGPAARGQWSILEKTDGARSVHAVLLQNGKLLIMAGSGNDRMAFEGGHFKSYVFNPLTEAWKEIPTPKDVFCSGHVQLANGNVLILGGTSAYPAPPKPGELPSTEYKGENASWIFNIRTEKYEEVEYNKAAPSNAEEPGPLLGGTWYPSATELGNGDVISFGGLNEQGQGSTKTNYFTGPGNAGSDGDASEQWVGFGSSKLQQTYSWFWGLYPSMILTADGRLFYDGSHVFGDGLEGDPEAPSGSSLYDFYCTPGKSAQEEQKEQDDTNPEALVETADHKLVKRIEDTPGLREPDMRDQSASLLLPPAQSQKVMILGGGNTYEANKNAIDLTDEIDLEEAKPHWIAGPDLPGGALEDGSQEPQGAGKMYVSAVELPDETVLETGGSMRPRTENVHEAAIFDPKTDSFTPVAADPVGRDYHSEALLLPDGRVLTLGSNPANPVTGEESFETRISIYEPPYLFKGERPVLKLIDGEANTLEGSVTKTTQWEYASAHSLTFSSASEIAKAVLIRPAAVTHSSDPNQREVELPITKRAGGEIEVQLTGNSNLAPPGYYMIFIVNSSGVPSVAQWVHVGAQGAPTP